MADEKLLGMIATFENDMRTRLDGLSNMLSAQLEPMRSYEPANAGGIEGPQLWSAVQRLSEGYTQVELLTGLVDTVAGFVPRALLLIRKSGNLIGWNARGFTSAFIDSKMKKVRWAIDAFPELTRSVQNGETIISNFSDLSEISDEISGFDGFVPFKSAFFPVAVKGKVAALLYVDSGASTQLNNLEAVRVLNYQVGLELTLVTSKIKVKDGQTEEGEEEARPSAKAEEPTRPVAPPVASPAPARASAPIAAPAQPQAAIKPAPAPPKPAPQAATVPVSEAAPSTGAALFPARSAVEAPGADEDPNVKKARRVARVLVSDLKLYNEAAVNLALQKGDLYGRLRDDIDRSYKHYQERIATLNLPNPKDNYFREEMVRQLLGGNQKLLGAVPF